MNLFIYYKIGCEFWSKTIFRIRFIQRELFAIYLFIILILTNEGWKYPPLLSRPFRAYIPTTKSQTGNILGVSGIRKRWKVSNAPRWVAVKKRVFKDLDHINIIICIFNIYLFAMGLLLCDAHLSELKRYSYFHTWHDSNLYYWLYIEYIYI